MTGREIVEAVADEWLISLDMMRAHTNQAYIVSARSAAIYMLRIRLGWSLPRIGKFLGGFHFTTVRYQLRAHNKRLCRDPRYRDRMAALQEKLPELPENRPL